ncbi:MAG: DUF1499 domain-containing protein [Spongiibacteraceae bacterium]|nr:DUF1499 domain-containing protein [Spongiibacteraceae bacterium]MBN4055607.1 DUF1499 domain-containing protein [bacterium AH-315-K03]
MNNEDVSTTALRIKTCSLLLLVLLPLAALCIRFEIFHFRVGVILLALSMIGCLLIQIINAIWLLRKPNAATKSTLRVASLFALPPLLLIANVIHSAGNNAMIHNISTDMDNPPAFVTAAEQRGDDSNPLAYTQDIADIQRKVYPDIHPIISTQSSADAFASALTVAKELGWEIYHQSLEHGLLEAVDTTPLFGFKDDIVIRITASDTGSRIDLRSVSRVGKSDMGANAKRISRFIKLFEQ